ncbi:MAG: tetratricopeptide repeat protein [Candidatus Kariarchaeaceae archaeon]
MSLEDLFKEGSDCIRSGDYTKAADIFNQALDIEPDNHELLYGRAYALKELQQYEETLEILNKIIILQPEFKWAWYDMGLVYGLQARYQSSIEAYTEALHIDPDFSDAQTKLAKMKTKLT